MKIRLVGAEVFHMDRQAARKKLFAVLLTRIEKQDINLKEPIMNNQLKITINRYCI